MDELASSSYVADTFLATRDKSQQSVQSTFPIDKSTYKEALQGKEGTPRPESAELAPLELGKSPLKQAHTSTSIGEDILLCGKSPVKAHRRPDTQPHTFVSTSSAKVHNRLDVQPNTSSTMKAKSVVEKKSAKAKPKKYKRKLATVGEVMPSSPQASVSSSNIRNRNAVLRRQSESTIEQGKLMGINYGDMEEDTIERIMASYKAEQHS
ncbi:hypothetical protein U1Q18_052439 [Sarracenia purpurea var. burkii]